jgi:hypothetical protein
VEGDASMIRDVNGGGRNASDSTNCNLSLDETDFSGLPDFGTLVLASADSRGGISREATGIAGSNGGCKRRTLAEAPSVRFDGDCKARPDGVFALDRGRSMEAEELFLVSDWAPGATSLPVEGSSVFSHWDRFRLARWCMTLPNTTSSPPLCSKLFAESTAARKM